VRLCIKDIPTGIQARFSGHGDWWYSNQTPDITMGGYVDYVTGTFLHLKIGDDAAIGPFTLNVFGADTCDSPDTSGQTLSISGEILSSTQTGDTTPPTVAATAYLNGTSPTGRTLTITHEPDAPGSERFDFIIYFNDTAIIAADKGNLDWQIPIPADWLAGTYNITWDHYYYTGQPAWGPLDSSGSETVVIPALTDTAADAAEEIVIPSWIKNNAGWWASNQIDDRAFVSGLQWLISNGIMNIPPTVQGAGSDDVIPSWIKNNAEWWADDLIDDRNFVTGLQWLITNGIMIIELE
jgi:hypothetical protein